MVHQQIEVVALGDFAEGVTGGRADQGIQACPALPFGVGLSNPFGQRLVGLLAALVVSLLGTQFGAGLFAAGQLFLQGLQCLLQRFGWQFRRGQGLVLFQALLAFLEQNLRLFQGFFTVLQTLAQLLDVVVIQGQQLFQAAVIQLGMVLAPLFDLTAHVSVFLFQRAQVFALGLEVAGQLDQPCLGVL
ncbi:hypothetical protein D3C77_453780 [compost metagenome]